MKKLTLAFALTLVLSLTPLAAANATVLFAGGEDSDFTGLANAAASTTSGTFSSSYARESMAVTHPSCGGGNNGYFSTPTFTAGSVVWVHANFEPDSVCGLQWGGVLLNVYSPDGYVRISVQRPGNNAQGQYNIYSANQAGTYTLLASMASACFASGSLVPFDLFINYSSSGQVTLYCNGTQVANYTGNVTTNSATTLSQVQFGYEGTGGSPTYWSEVIVSTTSTLGMRLATLTPNANGNTDTWDTGGVSNINTTTLSTTNPNASGTAAEEQEYAIGTSTIPSGSYSVVGVFLNAYSQVDTTGPQHLQGVVRVGGTDYTSANYSPTQSTWGVVSIPFLTNPATGSAWALSNLTASGFNIGFESQN